MVEKITGKVRLAFGMRCTKDHHDNLWLGMQKVAYLQDTLNPHIYEDVKTALSEINHHGAFWLNPAERVITIVGEEIWTDDGYDYEYPQFKF